MKKIFLIFTCFAFALAGCDNGSDDNGNPDNGNPDDGNPAGTDAGKEYKLVKKIVEKSYDGCWEFTYDNKGRLLTVYDDAFYYEIGTFSYSGNKVTINWESIDEEEYDWAYTYELTLNEAGYVSVLTEKEYDGDSYTYKLEYSVDDFFKFDYSDDYEDSNTATWTDGNVTDIVSPYSNVNFQYDDSYANKLNIDLNLLDLHLEGFDGDMMMYGFFGKKSKNLASKRIKPSYTKELSYDLDSDGYPVKVYVNGELGFTIEYTSGTKDMFADDFYYNPYKPGN